MPTFTFIHRHTRTQMWRLALVSLTVEAEPKCLCAVNWIAMHSIRLQWLCNLLSEMDHTHTHTHTGIQADEQQSTCNSRHLALFLTLPRNVVPWAATLTLKRHLVFACLAALGSARRVRVHIYACICRCYHSMPHFMPVKCHLCQMAYAESSEIWSSPALRKISI